MPFLHRRAHRSSAGHDWIDGCAGALDEDWCYWTALWVDWVTGVLELLTTTGAAGVEEEELLTTTGAAGVETG